MPARKSDVTVVVSAYGRSFSINAEELLHDQYRIKNGRTLSVEMPIGTATEITEEIRKFIVKQRIRNSYIRAAG